MTATTKNIKKQQDEGAQTSTGESGEVGAPVAGPTPEVVYPLPPGSRRSGPTQEEPQKADSAAIREPKPAA